MSWKSIICGHIILSGCGSETGRRNLRRVLATKHLQKNCPKSVYMLEILGDKTKVFLSNFSVFYVLGSLNKGCPRPPNP